MEKRRFISSLEEQIVRFTIKLIIKKKLKHISSQVKFATGLPEAGELCVHGVVILQELEALLAEERGPLQERGVL